VISQSVTCFSSGATYSNASNPEGTSGSTNAVAVLQPPLRRTRAMLQIFILDLMIFVDAVHESLKKMTELSI